MARKGKNMTCANTHYLLFYFLTFFWKVLYIYLCMTWSYKSGTLFCIFGARLTYWNNQSKGITYWITNLYKSCFVTYISLFKKWKSIIFRQNTFHALLDLVVNMHVQCILHIMSTSIICTLCGQIVWFADAIWTSFSFILFACTYRMDKYLRCSCFLFFCKLF